MAQLLYERHFKARITGGFRDLWLRKDLEPAEKFMAEIPPQGGVLLNAGR